MIRIISIFVFASITAPSFAQLVPPDNIQTSKGTLTIQPVFHGSLVLSWNNKTIYIDPYGGIKRYKDLKTADLILITDIHGDHMDTSTLNNINTTNSKLIVPQEVFNRLPEKLKAKSVVLNNGASREEFSIKIEAIPMYNLPDDSTARHTKGRGNGYVLNCGGKRIYISGDTEDIPEMRALKNIDVAFVCMNLPFTMDIAQAANAVLEFKPAVVYPYHYRGQGGTLSDTEGFKKLVNASNPAIDVRLRNWYTE